MSTTPILRPLSSLSRRPARMLHLKRSRIYRPVQGRAAYRCDVLPKRKPSNRRPSLATKLPSDFRPSNPPDAGANPGSSSTGREIPSEAAGPRSNEPQSQIPDDTTPPTYPLPHRPEPPLNRSGILQSREYKSTARKWVGSIIALPIFIVTSYLLFDRLILDNPPGRGTRPGVRENKGS